MVTRAPGGQFSLVHHVLETGARRQLTAAPQGFAENHPSVSPDGKTLAFARLGDGRAALFVVPMAGGEATRLGDWANGLIGGLTWTPDGQEILVAWPELSGRQIVRVAVNGSGPVRSVCDRSTRRRRARGVGNARGRELPAGVRHWSTRRRLAHGRSPLIVTGTPHRRGLAVLRCDAYGHAGAFFSRRHAGGVRVGPEWHSAGMGGWPGWIGAPHRHPPAGRHAEPRVVVA